MVKKANRPQQILETALDLASKARWSSISLREITVAAGVLPAEMYSLYPSKIEILKAYLASVDATVLKTKFAFDPEDSPRDRLFDVLMRRFDALSDDRDAVVSILAALRSDPMSTLCLSAGIYSSMRWMLETAEISTSGPYGCLTVKGLVALWFATLRIWERDESGDMVRTMAALDNNLRRAEWLRSMLPSSLPLSRRNGKPQPDHVHA